MPVVRARNPRITANLASTCDILSDEDAYLTSVAARALRDLTRREEDGLLVLDAARLAALEVAVARRVARAALLSVCPGARLEARHIAGVLGTVAAGEGSLTVPMGVSVRVEHGLLVIRGRGAVPAPSAAWLEVPGRLELADGRALAARIVEVPAGGDAAARARAHALEWDGESVLLACGLTPRARVTSSARLGCTVSQRRSPICSARLACRSMTVPLCPWCASRPLAGSCGLPPSARTSACVARLRRNGCSS